MKTFLSFLLLFATGTWLVVDRPHFAAEAVRQVDSIVHRFFFEKELRIQGIEVIQENAIRSALPLERSNLWWRLHLSALEAPVSSIPLIKETHISACSWISLGCFSIAVQERKAAFVALSKDEAKAWIIGEDGGFIAPITHEQFRMGVLDVFGDQSRDFVIVRGLWSERYSPDEIRSRILALSLAIKIFHEELIYDIDRITLGEGRDFEIQFRKLPFPVVFELDTTTLREASKRLRNLIGDLRGSFDSVDHIDLAFHSMGVMRLKNSAVASPTPKERAKGRKK